MSFLFKFFKKSTLEELDKYISDVYKAPEHLDVLWQKNFKIEPIPKAKKQALPKEEHVLFQPAISCEERIPDEIEPLLKKVEMTFSQKLMELISKHGLDEVEVYKKAEIDRRHFSKIRSSFDYKPTKDTVILLSLSMRLTLMETKDLLKRAGLALSKSDKKDIIAEFFFKKKIYEIPFYKEALFKYGFLAE